MKYASDAQRKFFHTAGAKKAGITKKEVEDTDKNSKGMKLPEKKGNLSMKKKMPKVSKKTKPKK